MFRKLKERLLFFISQTKSRFKNFKSFSKFKKIIIASGASFVLFIVITLIIAHQQAWWTLMNSTSITHLNDYADESHLIQEPKKTLLFDKAFPFHGFNIFLKKIVVNLSPTPEHPSAMAAFKINLNLTTQLASIEIKEREVAIIDRVQRAIEQLSYEEAKKTGNFKLKNSIKNAINSVIKNGKVKTVYFDTIILKP